ncbi:hypothetical protein K466DRAFT_327594 [Polyporus arcularius HHB13444]|uniref:Uncharacterized protein n=1 Tax=Polyporus arcularius HHB13444 TaxID=1314778 RepID=A0A5C3NYA0_9APHY|nr:hypothetical protein K466DRAFT_327594 [Polyporus arcularius HHB13444]
MPLFGKHKKTDTTTHHGDHSNKLTRNDPNMTAGAQDPYANQGVNQGPNYGAQGAMGSDPYAHQHTAGAPGTGAGAGMNEPPVPPATHINSDNRSGSGAGRLAGKAERGLGTLVGSQALKEKGMQKEQEAGAFKQQSAEIAEAERLEKEALLRRERAVAHGAHPDNRQLGGLQNANTLSDVHGVGNVGGAGGGYGAGSGTY